MRGSKKGEHAVKKVDELFKATAANLWETMTSHAGTAGFRIPEYQRAYNWDYENVARLLEDTANGLFYLTSSDESFTFLGTIILVSEKTKETTFDGNVSRDCRRTTTTDDSCSNFLCPN